MKSRMVKRVGISFVLAVLAGCLDLGGTPPVARDVFTAIRSHDVAGVRQYLADGGSLDQRSPDGDSLLIMAVVFEDLAIVQLLCESGAEVNDTDVGRRPALHMAAFRGNAPIVQYLLDHAADPMLRDRDGLLPIHNASANMTILGGNIPLVLDQLIRAGNAIDQRDQQGRQPLHYAATSMDTGTVAAVLNRGGDVFAEDSRGYPPSRYVIDEPRHQASEVVPVLSLLLERGADVHWTNPKTGNSLLHVEAWNGRLPVVRLLLEYGADVNAVNSFGDTPLHAAASGGRADVVYALLRAGATLSCLNDDGENAAASALREGHEALARRLDRRAVDAPER